MATRVTPLSLSDLYECSECKFWEQDAEDEWGHCHRFGRDTVPLTLADDFCDEWLHFDAPSRAFFQPPFRREPPWQTEAIKQVSGEIVDRKTAVLDRRREP